MNENYNIESIFLILIGITSHLVQVEIFEAVYFWGFRILTLFSILLLIYINWDNAKKIYRNRKNRKK